MQVNCWWFYDCHADAVVRRGAHCPMEHIQGFTWSHWMPPSGKSLRCIAPTATMVNEFVETTLNTKKTQILSSNYGTFRSLVICENFVPLNKPSTQLIDATSCIKMWDAMIEAAELANISSYQTMWENKNWKSYQNSLTPKSVLAGTKYSRSEGFWLAKHKHTNIPTMMEPFPPPVAWFWWMKIPQFWEPLRKGLVETIIEGFCQNQYSKRENNYLYCFSINYNNLLLTVNNDSQNGIHCCQRARHNKRITRIHSNKQHYSSALFLLDPNMVV